MNGLRGRDMNKIKFTAATVAVAMLAGTTWFYRRAEGKETPSYRTAPVTRATLTSTVSATGALSAVRTVQVGTQASGQIGARQSDVDHRISYLIWCGSPAAAASERFPFRLRSVSAAPGSSHRNATR